MNQNALLTIFPFVFVGLWVASTALLGRFSGWYALQERYPQRDEIALVRLRMQSARFGESLLGGANFGNCLRFDVCPSGLRVAVWRVFGPFSQPFLVPWAEITVAKKKGMFLARQLFGSYRLGLGRPEAGCMIISGRAARRIEAASNGFFRLPPDG